MRQGQPSKLIQIHVSEADRFEGKPLYEAIVAKCREKQIAGVTVFRGLEGYGEKADLHRTHLLRHNLPIIIVVADTAERIAALLPAIEPMLDTGMIAMSDVLAVRVNKSAAS